VAWKISSDWDSATELKLCAAAGIATKKLLNRNRLLESLQLLQLNPLIQNLSAELSAGRVLVQVLEVQTEAKSVFKWCLITVESPGSFRRRQANELNFLGQEIAQPSLPNTEGSNALDASYVFP